MTRGAEKQTHLPHWSIEPADVRCILPAASPPPTATPGLKPSVCWMTQSRRRTRQPLCREALHISAPAVLPLNSRKPNGLPMSDSLLLGTKQAVPSRAYLSCGIVP